MRIDTSLPKVSEPTLSKAQWIENLKIFNLVYLTKFQYAEFQYAKFQYAETNIYQINDIDHKKSSISSKIF